VEEGAIGLLVDKREYPDIESHPDMRTAGEVMFDIVVVLCDKLRDMLENAELHLFSLIVYDHEHILFISRIVVEDETEIVHPIPRVDKSVVLFFAKKDTPTRILDGVSSVNTNPLVRRYIFTVYERKIAFELRRVAIGELIYAFRNHTASIFECIAKVTSVDE
jgi:hypothetical protein